MENKTIEIGREFAHGGLIFHVAEIDKITGNAVVARGSGRDRRTFAIEKVSAWISHFEANNTIRFIDSHYNTLFTVPDKGSIEITFPNGEKVKRQCRYLDETHFEISNECLHICQFAEMMERNGNTYAPAVTEPVRDKGREKARPGKEERER